MDFWLRLFARDHEAIAGEKLTAEQIIASDSAAAKASFERLCDRIARALGAVINVVDPDVIVLGGGLSNVDALYTIFPRFGTVIFSQTSLKHGW